MDPKPIAIGVVVALSIAACASTSQPTSSPPITPARTALPTETPGRPTSPATTPRPDPDLGLGWIVYQSNAGLSVIRPDGSGSHAALPAGAISALHADWSWDGLRLAYAVDEPNGTRDIWVSGWDGSNAELLLECEAPCVSADSPAWSPDGTRIAFEWSERADGRFPRLRILDLVTGAIRTIESPPPDYLVGPRWSADGTDLVVEIDRYDGSADDSDVVGAAIAVVDLTDPASNPPPRILSGFETWASYPDWDPVGDLILFAAGSPDPLDPTALPSNLFTVRPDGSDVRQITFQGPADGLIWMPAFRRDGLGILATLVHRAPNAGALTLISMNSDGSALVEIGIRGPTPGAHARQRPSPAAP